MRRALVSTASVAAVMAGGLVLWGRASAGEAPSCPLPKRAVLYPDVQPIFERHCSGCHLAAKSDNRAAQRVFEMSRYPFSTARPTTLLHDLRKMFINRGRLSQAEKCTGITWIDGGARDAAGKPPRWRPPAET